ncbi:amino acid adenylation domain-containing protein, partial [Trinickia sp.]|uniref:amino acid adenylation domain-containing protein n=1 Tax=Trinickia sp. TaxID=2571163 RepID=UPI003F808653
MIGTPAHAKRFPLTSAQREVWLDQLVHGDAPVYKIGGYVRIDGPVDAALFERAVNLLVEKHDALRAVLAPADETDDTPTQAIAASLPVLVPLHDFSNADDPQAAALAYARRQLAQPFPLNGSDPLFRFELLKLNGARYFFTLDFHHLIVDGWGIGLLVDSLCGIYTALTAGAEPTTLAPSYEEFAAHDQAYRESPAFERQRAYWLEKYDSPPDPLFPPRYRERYGYGASPSGHHALRMTRGFFERIARFARQRESTPFHVILALLHVYYARTLQRDEIVVGVPILNRPNARLKQMVGMCAGVAAVRLPFDDAVSFDALLQTIGRTLKQDFRHQRFPLSELNRELGLLKSQRAQLFDLSVSYERDDYDLRMGEGRARIFMLSSGYEQTPLMVHIRENPFDDEAWIHLMYNRAWFDDAEIEATGQRLLVVLDQVLDDPLQPVGQLALTTPSERQTLARWSQAKASYDSNQTIHGRFEEVAALTPDAVALTFGHRSLTYGQLNARANRLARRLTRIGIRADDRVAICAERGIEMIVGLLAILKAGGAYVPLDPSYPAERLAWMLEDSAPVATLLQAGVQACIEPGAAPIVSFDSENEADELDDEGSNVRLGDPSPERLAYVIYTSGSTGRPKGVMIEHRNVMRLFAATDAWFGFGRNDVWALFHSFAFDFSVWEIWGALLHGGRLVIVPYLTSRSPRECHALLCAEGVTVLNQTPSAFRQLIAAQGEADACPHRLRTVIFGGEALELSILAPWFERAVNKDVRLVNMYGITETTVHVTYRPIRASDLLDREHASVNAVGEPIPDLSVHVLDARMQPVPIGVEGELYVGGAGLARGYLNRPELTQARFVRDPFSEDDAARLYRSGDVGRWLPNGELEYLGRNDEQVKVRGFRIELGEIEAALADADGIAEAVVVAREDGQGDKRLVAYYMGSPRDAATLRAHMLARMPEYMLPSAYVRLDRFPLTPNGKLDRRALPAPGGKLQEGRAYEAPQGFVETQLALIWAEVLDVERVGRHDHFFELGGHSLLAVKVIERMRRLGMQADVKVLFNQPTLEALAAAAAGSTPPADAPENRIAKGCARITPDMLPLVALDQAAIDRIVSQAPGGIGNIQDIYPLAPLQQGILYHHVSASEGDPYIMQVLLGVDSRARLDALIDALQTVVERHDVFRTIVLWEGLDEPVQVVLREARLHTQEVALDADIVDVAAHMQAQFDPRHIRLDLKRAPLMKIAYAPTHDEGRWVAVLLFHHLVDDATSLRLLRREVARIMRGEGNRLPEQLAYRRYVAQTLASRSDSSDSSDEGHEAFFREMLGSVTEPTLPYGIADVHGDGRGIAEAKHDVSPALSARIRRRAQRLGVSVATLYHLAWARVVGALCGREDVVFGTVLMGRLLSGGDVDRAMGMFINTLPVRINVGALSVRDAVMATHRRLSALLSHEHATLVLAQRCSGVAAPLPLFNALLNFRHGDADAQHSEARLDWDGIDILDFVERTNYPLMLAVDDTGEAFSLTVQAIAGIDAGRVTRYVARAIEGIVDALEQAPHQSVNALAFLPEAERHEVLETFNATATAYPAGETVHGLFEQQAARTPEAVALIYEGRDYRYGELDARAAALAHRLVERGVLPDTHVAICVERSPEMVIGLLAILKAGGAYVPLDPGYPAERLRYMLADSAPIVLLVHEATAGLFRGDDLDGVQTVDIGPFANVDAHAAPNAFAGPALTLPRAEPNHLAYVIYTSGSTGQPKGVMNEHHAVVNRLRWMRDALAVTEHDAVLQKTPFSFDVSVWEFFLPLMTGARLVLARAGGHKDPFYLSELIERERVTMAHFVPSMLQAFVDHARRAQCASLKRVICSGEALPGHLLRRFDEAFHTSTLYNLYGPTEAAVDVTAWAASGAELDAATDNPPIGKPIANTRIYILDANGQPAPIGVPGEIHIGGAQVARGYLNRPALTAEKFVDDPFSSAPAARMYRTGDLGRWLPDGNIEYLGRDDDQIKLRGFRIELGEIEAKLSEIVGVREAVVLAREDEPGDKRLVAYVTGEAVDIDALRRHAAAQLPDYMAPAAYVPLAALPLTPNGKLDRKALPAPERTAYSRNRYESPREGTEQTLAAIWASLLKVERVGRRDNFFELGGHSLLMMGLIERMRRVELRADIRLLFSAPTLAELAACVERSEGAPALPPNLIPAAARQITPPMLTLVSLDQRAVDIIVSTVRGGAENVQDIYPLAPLQQGILYHHLSTAHGDPYVLHGMFGFDRRERVDAFLAAFARVIARHDALRTSIVWEGLDEPVQVVWRDAKLQVEEVTLDADEDDAARALRTRFDTRRTRLDLHRPPLMRFVFAYDAGGERWLGMLLFHHLALDHAALDIVRHEVQAFLLDPDAVLPEPMPYRAYVARSRQGVSQAAHEAFFSDMLRDIDEPTLPYGRGEVQGDGGAVHEHTEAISPSLSARLIAQARAYDVSAAGVLHTVWGAVLSGLAGGQEEVVFGTVLLGRFERAEEASRTVGLFINTLPLRVSVGALDVSATIKATAARLAVLLQHEHASLALAQRCSGVAAPAPLFGALLNYRHSDASMTATGARETWSGVETIGSHERTNYPLVLSVDDFGGEFSMTVQAIEGIDAQRVAGYVLQALESVVDALEHTPHTPMHSLTIVPARERRQLLETFNATAVAYPAGDTVHALFERQAARTPDAIAIVQGNEQYSYRTLDARADALAHRLIALGAVPDTRVAVCVERSFDMIVALLAVLKAGAAYVPLDPSYPPERLRYLLEDSAPVALLLHEATSALFDGASAPTVDVGECQPNRGRPVAPVEAEHLAYVIYTSGSTGQPKGVMVEHRHLVNLVRWHCDAFSLAPAQRTTAMAGVGFDAAAWEIWPALCSGASLLLPPASAARDPERLLAWWHAQEVDVGFLVTPLAELAYATERANAHARAVLIGGDRLTRWPEGMGRNQALVNNYGPTEAAVVATSGALHADDATLHIGKPIANVRIYILDRRGRPAPIGVPGEIHIGGAQVARGYLNRPQLTAEKFVRDPFDTDPTSRMYRTGDLGRWLPDGNIEYLGRNDDQVKIRGVRIEPAEIEAVLSSVDGIRSVAVIARANPSGEKLLVAYYTCSPGSAAGDLRDVDGMSDASDMTAALRAAAARDLPAHMAPAAFVRMESLPLTANGKLDRKGLPAPDASAPRTHDPIAPINETEHTVARIWAELLGVERVGRDENFFELGGHSLLAVRLVERMRRAGLKADVQTLFAMPTVAALARAATKTTSAAVPPNLIPRGARCLTPDMLTLVDLSEDEIESIVAGVPGGAPNVQDIYPLAALQEGVLYHHLASDRGDAYLLRSRVSFDSRSALDRFIAALQACVERHDVLRTAIVWEGLREPVQVVLRAAELPVWEAPIDPSLGDAYAQLSQRFDPRHYRLDIRRAPLMQAHIAHDAASGRWLLVLLFHHIVLDHTGIDVLLQDVQAHLQGRWHTLPAPASFRAYIAQTRARLTEREHESFFKQMLADVDEPTLPYGLVDVREGGDTIAQARYEIDTALSHRLRALSRGMGVSAASLFHLAWAHVLGKLSGREDVVFGTVLLGRWQAAEGAERALGLFINTLPIRVRVGALGSRDALLATHGTLSGLLGHEHAPLALAQRCSSIAAPTPLFSALLNFRHSAPRPAGAANDADGWKGIEILDGEERTNYPCALSVDDLGDGFSLTAQIDDRFEAARVCEYVNQTLRSLADALEHAPDTPVHRLPMLPPEERRRLLETWNDTDRPFPGEAAVPALFEAHVLRSPDAPAIVDRGDTITYAQLNARANAVARRLLLAGVQRGERIGVLLDRSAALIVAELAILKCGATYVPLDSNAPAQRQA